MGPVRIKAYGLVWITRRTYLRIQFLGFLLVVALMVIGGSVMNRTGVYVPHWPAMDVQDDLLYQALLSFFWVGLLFLIAGSLETIMLLRRFARAEAEQKARLATLEPSEPAPPAPNSPEVQASPAAIPNTNIQP